MRRGFTIVLLLCLAFAATAVAQEKVAEKPKTEVVKDLVEVVLYPGATENSGVAVVSVTNKDVIRSLSLPLGFTCDDASVKIDSLSYVGTRCADYGRKQFKLFPDSNAVMLMVLSGQKDKKYVDLSPGTGEVVKLYLSGKNTFPTKSFAVKPVNLPPNNKLMFVTNGFGRVNPSFVYRVAGKKVAPKPLKKGK